jgi:hypothetical protein
LESYFESGSPRVIKSNQIKSNQNLFIVGAIYKHKTLAQELLYRQ